MSYKVIYDREGCIGANSCAGALPDYWKLDGEKKAILRDSALNPETGKYELIIAEKDFESFKESALVCPVFVIDIIDTQTQKSVLNLVTSSGEVEKESAPVIEGKLSREQIADGKGFFKIRVVPENNQIKAHYYSPKHTLLFIITGKNAKEIYHTVVNEGFVTNLAYAAYLGEELAKAESALRKGLPYQQDQPLP